MDVASAIFSIRAVAGSAKLPMFMRELSDIIFPLISEISAFKRHDIKLLLVF